MAGLHDGHRRRLMQKAFDYGIDKLELHEIIEILLFNSIPRGNTNEIAHRLLNKFGDLHGICNADVSDLTSIEGVGTKTAEYLKMLPTCAKLYEIGAHGARPYLDTQEKLGSYCVSLLNNLKYEEMHILFLTTRKQLISRVCINKGDDESVTVEYKDVIRSALAYNPDYAVLTHNHPSGITSASYNDIKFTKQLKLYFKDLGIVLYDHILVAEGNYISFRETTNIF